ncbi:MAG: hypothetical protein F6K35_42295 [Okeania sp. SIO2H7]|nr:hypothetical protein [Okeania sp. SIO2H7]
MLIAPESLVGNMRCLQQKQHLNLGTGKKVKSEIVVVGLAIKWVEKT